LCLASPFARSANSNNFHKPPSNIDISKAISSTQVVDRGLNLETKANEVAAATHEDRVRERRIEEESDDEDSRPLKLISAKKMR